VLAREQNLSAIDGLAAAAAHQLGTPLSTIALVVNEMAKEVAPGSALSEDVAVLREEAARCRDILARIASMGTEPEGPLFALPLSQLLDEIVAPHRGLGAEIDIRLEGEQPEPVIARNAAILYGLGNIIENAIDFARRKAVVRGVWTRERLSIAIEDDGPGFAPEILSRLGDPYVSTRQIGRTNRAPGEHGGMGLGLFIAKTLLERSGARLSARNLGPPAGASVEIAWPRPALDVIGGSA
jgi:two-component system, sensor histidine kinase RegB